MVTVKRESFESFEDEIEFFGRIRAKIHQVKLNALNMYDSELKTVRKPWLGQVDRKKNQFKIWRVTGGLNHYTSDFAVIGTVQPHKDGIKISVAYKVNPLTLLGLLGLLVFIYAIGFLLGTKGIVIHDLLLAFIMLIIGLSYGFWKIRDLNKSSDLLKKLIHVDYNQTGIPNHMQNKQGNID